MSGFESGLSDMASGQPGKGVRDSSRSEADGPAGLTAFISF